MRIEYNKQSHIESYYDEQNFCYMQNKRIDNNIFWTKTFRKPSQHGINVKEDIVYCQYYKKNNIERTTCLQKELNNNFILSEETFKKVGNNLLTINKSKHLDGRIRSKRTILYENNNIIKMFQRFEENRINTFAEAIDVDKQTFKVYRFHKNSKLYSFRIKTNGGRLLKHGVDINSNNCAFYWNNGDVFKSMELL